MNTVGIVGGSRPASVACCLYWASHQRYRIKFPFSSGRGLQLVHAVSSLIFNPIHLIVPTSACVRGDSTRSISMTSPDGAPGSSTELPLNTVALTVWPLYSASPTSTLWFWGSPMSIFEGYPFGTNLANPVNLGLEKFKWDAG